MKERILESLAILIAGLFSAEKPKLNPWRDLPRSDEPAESERSDAALLCRVAEEHPKN